tara:strand:+ start:10676 stop:10975 length:300 start_codon:yes stop_codon:yes gene_type:complete
MEGTILQVFIAVLGVILVSLLTAVTFYFRNINTNTNVMSLSMAEMNIKLQILITKHDNTEELAKVNAEAIMSVQGRLHSLEGRDKQMMYFIDNYAKKHS